MQVSSSDELSTVEESMAVEHDESVSVFSHHFLLLGTGSLFTVGGRGYAEDEDFVKEEGMLVQNASIVAWFDFVTEGMILSAS